MPLAILLQEQLGILTKGVDEKLRHWDEATEKFVLVVDRLRSAYLVHWFGTSLPSVGLSLKVGLANMHELRARWIAVGAGDAGTTPPVGQNLTEPLLGAGGILVGMFATPLNGILLATTIGSLVDTWWAKTFAVVNWLTAGTLLTALLPAGALGLAFGLTGYAISGQPRELFDFLGVLAELAEPLQRFWEQVTGPREAVRNPLLREVLLLGDRAAALVALVLGSFAVLVTRVGPFLEPLRLGFVAVAGLVVDLWPVIVLAFAQTVDFVVGLVGGADSVPALLRIVVAAFAAALRRIGVALGATFAAIRSAFSALTTRGGLQAESWWSAMAPVVRAETVDHPTVRYVRSFVGSLGALSSWRARGAAPAGPPSPPGRLARIVGGVLRSTGMPSSFPTLPNLPSLPPLLPLDSIGTVVDVMELLRGIGFGIGPANPLELTTEGMQVLERAARPPSVFGAEWAALEAESRRPEPLARALETAAYLSIARRVVGPAAAAAVRSLEDVLSRIDAVVRNERERLPVKDVPEPTELTPVIQRLHVRSRGRAAEALEAWVADLRLELNALEYPVPVGG